MAFGTMALGNHVFLYCERGSNPALLAEPVNAASNAAFLLAALIALAVLLRKPAHLRSADHYLLLGLVFAIGLGSLAFHLYATKGAELADTIPIGIFMLVYLGFALNRLLGVPPGWTVLLLIGFAAICGASFQLRCFNGGIGFPTIHLRGTDVCMNGSVPYLPALAAMAIIGGLLRERGGRAGVLILWAAVVFAVSVALRSLDLVLCSTLSFHGHAIGTHAFWHVLNAVTLFLLLLASFEAPPGEGRARLGRPAAEDHAKSESEAGSSFL